MRKLTDKIKYEVINGHADLFAVKKTTQKFERFGTCHLSVLDFIRANGFKAACESGVIIPVT